MILDTGRQVPGTRESSTQPPTSPEINSHAKISLLSICLTGTIKVYAAHSRHQRVLCEETGTPLTVALLLPWVALLVGILLLGVGLLLCCALLVPSLLLTVLGVSCGKKGYSLISGQCRRLPVTHRTSEEPRNPSTLSSEAECSHDGSNIVQHFCFNIL